MPTKLSALPLPELRRTVERALAVIDPAVEAMEADRAAFQRETAREKRDALCRSNAERVRRVSAQLNAVLPGYPGDVAQSLSAFATPNDWAAANDDEDASDEIDASDESDEDDEDDDAPPVQDQAREVYVAVKQLVEIDDSPELRAHAEVLFEQFESAETLSRLAEAMQRFADAARAWAALSGENGRGDLFVANLAALVGKRGGPN